MMKEWFTSAEFPGLKGMPAHPTNVTRKAKAQNWQYRQINRLMGVNFEYHVSSLVRGNSSSDWVGMYKQVYKSRTQ